MAHMRARLHVRLSCIAASRTCCVDGRPLHAAVRLNWHGDASSATRNRCAMMRRFAPLIGARCSPRPCIWMRMRWLDVAHWLRYTAVDDDGLDAQLYAPIVGTSRDCAALVAAVHGLMPRAIFVVADAARRCSGDVVTADFF
ncbi:hypothetical protein F511_22392 [Dorcoceras hygrometricum]|uniref:Uncharacterized protein n=1 Tax=Dorcoceras hygrometricum TaxID=472368 RepID=A0A2Z7B6L6_9LAMI|nr:hypothetical protein F511_22392 [Dorcoceras hygrometricum]